MILLQLLKADQGLEKGLTLSKTQTEVSKGFFFHSFIQSKHSLQRSLGSPSFLPSLYLVKQCFTRQLSFRVFQLNLELMFVDIQGKAVDADQLTDDEWRISSRKALKGFTRLDARYFIPFFTRKFTRQVC